MKEHADPEWNDLPPAAKGADNRPPGSDAGGSWDDQPVARLRLGDLDGEMLARFRQQAGLADEGDAALLESLQLFHLKRAALLLFHPAPEKQVAGAYIRIGRFDRQQALVDHHLIGGPLFAQLDAALALLEGHLQQHGSHAGDDGLPLPPERYPVPLEALREALLNALVHKDYASGLPIQIRLHAERILLWNPARLPEDWTPASAKARRLSRPGNPDIAHAFQRAGLIGGWGLGMDRLFETCRSRALPEPVLRREQDGLWVEFSLLRASRPAARRATPGLQALATAGRAVTSEVSGELTGHAASEVAGYAAGHVAGEDAGEVAGHVQVKYAGHVAGEDSGHVTGEVARLLRACEGVMSRKALQDALGLRSDANFRTLYLVPALESGLLEMTIPDKPKSSRQQYRLSAAGRAWRQRG